MTRKSEQAQLILSAQAGSIAIRRQNDLAGIFCQCGKKGFKSSSDQISAKLLASSRLPISLLAKRVYLPIIALTANFSE